MSGIQEKRKESRAAGLPCWLEPVEGVGLSPWTGVLAY